MTLSSIYYLLRVLRVGPSEQTIQTSSPMNNFNFSDCRKAVNQATFRPTAERKALAAKLLQEALDFVNNLEEVKQSEPKAKAKRRRKTTKKATPQQRVADRQEKAFHGKADTPVKPSEKAKTASVSEAKASLAEMDEKRSLAKANSPKAKLAAKRRAEAEARKAEAEASTAKAVTADDSRIASLEAKIEALTACLAVAMESMTPASPSNEVSFDDVPFQF